MSTIVLESLLIGAKLRRVRGETAALTHLTSDSRRVQPGGGFVALSGQHSDGHDHLAQVIERAAAAIVVAPGQAHRVPEAPGVAVYECAQPRSLLAEGVRTLHDAPDRALTMLAVTGTNGKTTVTHVLRDLLQQTGTPCGLLGTIRYRTGARELDAPLTTPGVEDFYAYLAEMRQAGLAAVAFEASSHALDQERLGPCEVDAAAFLNLTHEHLDYHQTLEAYLAAKLRLVERIGGERHKAAGRCVVFAEDRHFAALTWPASTLFFGRSKKADLRLVDAALHRDGISLRVRWAGKEFDAQSRLVGAYNVENLLAAITCLLAIERPLEAILSALPAVDPVPGRMEPVELPSGPLCVIDYAHTPDGIQSALAAMRAFVPGKLVIVFGCGGDRDRSKRAPMAAAALAGADRAVLTLDNPRTEDLRQIFADARVGFAASPRGVEVVDRAEAIAEALRGLTPDDGVLIAGKGHERYQILGREKTPWDDREVVRRAFAAQRSK